MITGAKPRNIHLPASCMETFSCTVVGQRLFVADRNDTVHHSCTVVGQRPFVAHRNDSNDTVHHSCTVVGQRPFVAHRNDTVHHFCMKWFEIDSMTFAVVAC